MRILSVWPALLVLALCPAASYANKPLFESEVPLQAVLSAPIAQVYKERKKDIRLYREGSISYLDEQGATQRLKVKVRTRGNFRREHCGYPPLSLNFVKKANDNNLFARQDILKLVGPCKKGAAYQDYVGLEYLAYKLWQQVSPYHFRTRLVEMRYVDSAKKRKIGEATTFLIEDIDDVAERVSRERLKQNRVERENMNLQQTALLEVFQLLIGNNDYSTLAAPEGEYCCHNARLLVEPGKVNGAVPVPYDFDASGIVDTSYASPPAQYPIKKVRERYFSGWCKENVRFQQAIDTFKSNKAELYRIVEEASVISDKSRSKTRRYLDSFYAMIEDPGRVRSEIIGRCRGEVIKG